MMYKCRDCGEEFHEPRYHHVEYSNPQLCVYLCPECGSEEVEEGESCPLCWRFAKKYVVCDDCADNIRERFSELLHAEFTEDEITALNEIYDGKDLI